MGSVRRRDGGRRSNIPTAGHDYVNFPNIGLRDCLRRKGPLPACDFLQDLDQMRDVPIGPLWPHLLCLDLRERLQHRGQPFTRERHSIPDQNGNYPDFRALPERVRNLEQDVIFGRVGYGLEALLHDRQPARPDQREEHSARCTLGHDLLQPLHPRLQAACVKKHILAAESIREPLVQELGLAPRVFSAVVDENPQLRLSHVACPPQGRPRLRTSCLFPYPLWEILQLAFAATPLIIWAIFAPAPPPVPAWVGSAAE